MRISRIYIQQPINAGSSLTLTDQAAHYLGKVLRLTPQTPITLFNSDGFEYSGIITALAKKHVEVNILEQISVNTESSLKTILGLGISRGERMDYAIQKSTELGISEIVPLFTEHGEVKLKGDRIEKRQAHWQQVAVSACEQSGRVVVPTVHRPRPLKEWIKTLECAEKLIFDASQAQSLSSEAPNGNVALLIGPEGGFSNKEISEARESGFAGIKLGPRILRTETAPVSVLSVLQYLWGDFN